MPRVGVSISEEQKEDLRHHAEELALSLSATLRTLAWRQLRYEKWVRAGRPRRRKGGSGDRTPSTAPNAMDIKRRKPEDGT